MTSASNEPVVCLVIQSDPFLIARQTCFQEQALEVGKKGGDTKYEGARIVIDPQDPHIILNGGPKTSGLGAFNERQKRLNA